MCNKTRAKNRVQVLDEEEFSILDVYAINFVWQARYYYTSNFHSAHKCASPRSSVSLLYTFSPLPFPSSYHHYYCYYIKRTRTSSTHASLCRRSAWILLLSLLYLVPVHGLSYLLCVFFWPRALFPSFCLLACFFPGLNMGCWTNLPVNGTLLCLYRFTVLALAAGKKYSKTVKWVRLTYTSSCTRKNIKAAVNVIRESRKLVARIQTEIKAKELNQVAEASK